ncbi:MAG: hypothetical protein IPK19_31270 [Chloroflexi bacterium]|nr:hypothetical protein [Chloroflexota bacterium]
MLSLNILGSLAQSAVLLFALTSAYSLVSTRSKGQPVQRSVIQGIVFGLFGIVNMVSPIAVASGIFIDARAVIGVLSGAYGGR